MSAERVSDPWHCRRCHATADLAAHPTEIGLVRLAVRGEEGFQLGSAGMEDAVAPLLAPCSCGGRLAPGPGTGALAAARFDEDALRPLVRAGWERLEASADARLAELRRLWRARALRLLGRDGELSRDEAQRLQLEARLAALAADVERARTAGDDDAAQAAHARYIELGTMYVRRFLLADADGRPA